MMKLKKSLLSVAAATAIAATSLAAGYVPLTTTTADNTWVSFGVSGLKSASGGLITTTEAGQFNIPNLEDYVLIDDTKNSLAAYGIVANDVDGNEQNMVKLYNIDESKVEIRIKPVNPNTNQPLIYVETDPLHTMFVSNGSDIMFYVTYKDSLEGYTMQYKIGTDEDAKVYQVTLDSDHVFMDPAVGVLVPASSSGGSEDTGSLAYFEADTDNDIYSIVDYNLSNNPAYFESWDAETHSDPLTTEQIRFYTYDAENQDWLIYDSGNTESNDFRRIYKGKAYWGKLDTNATENTRNNDIGSLAGVVLGAPDTQGNFYADAGLTDGWNFISFPEDGRLREVSTGMIITLVAATDNIEITDSSGLNTATISIDGSDVSAAAKAINAGITLNKANGTLPASFDLKAFPSTPGTDLVLISNKRFSIADPNNTVLGAVTTLAGTTNLLVPNTGTYNATTNVWFDAADAGEIADIGSTANGVMSTYGEYAMAVEVPAVVGSSTLGLTPSTFSFQVRKLADNTDETIDTLGDDSNISQVATNISGGSAVITNAVPLSINMDNNASYILLAGTEEFAIRDHTFTRVFDTVDSDGETSIIQYVDSDGTTQAANAIDANGTTASATLVAAEINTNLTNVDAAALGTKVILVNTQEDESNYHIIESNDILKPSTSSDDRAKGAFGSAIKLSTLATKKTYNVISLDLNDTSTFTDADHNVTFTFNTIYGTSIMTNTQTSDLNYSTGSGNEGAFNTYMNGLLTTAFSDLEITATSEVNGTDINSSVFTITSPDITSISLTFSSGESNVPETNATEGYLFSGDISNPDTISGDISGDIEYNYVSVPNYPLSGPMYTMREAGFTLEALVGGYTNISTGKIGWDSLDLTVNPYNWYTDNNFDLFDTYVDAAYWAKLSTTPSNDTFAINADSISFTPEYTYSFNKDGSTLKTFNNVDATLTVTVDGMPTFAEGEQTDTVIAQIGDYQFELTNDTDYGSSSITYSGSFSSRDLTENGIDYNDELSIKIIATDGLGNKDTITAAQTIDFKKPETPVVSTNGGTSVAFGGTDGIKFWVFSNNLPKEGSYDYLTSNSIEINSLDTEGTISVACTDNKAIFSDPADGLSVVAMDDGAYEMGHSSYGDYGYGNLSDPASIGFMPILSNRILVTDVGDGSSNNGTTGGTVYSADCSEDTATDLTGLNTGMEVTLIDDNTGSVKVAYDNIGTFPTNHKVPTTIYVKVNNDIVRLEYYMTDYTADDADRSVFIESTDGKVYGLQLFNQADLDVAGQDGETDTNPIDTDTLDASGDNVLILKEDVSL